MRLPLIPVLILFVVNLLIDWYICRAIKRRMPRRHILYRIAVASSAALAAVLVVLICLPKRSGDDSSLMVLMWVLFGYISVYVPKMIFIIFDLLASIPRIIGRRRIKALSLTGIVMAAATFLLIWWGALINRFNIRTNEITVEIENLPDSFDGTRLVQFSDFHSGSFSSGSSFPKKLVDHINSLNPDAVLFTGDIVNRRSSELKPFIHVLSGLEAPRGVYAILGNHDYGDYFDWPSPEAKARNMRQLYAYMDSMGWNLLDNRTAMLRNGSDSIAIIGVENVGDPPFPTYGNLAKAYPGDLSDSVTKILMSHNPAHWTSDIEKHPECDIPLTLSGHTHAMQIELFGLSPVSFRYPKWGGLYSSTDGRRRLYVNIGVGEVAFPARIGATPEVTLITLRKKSTAQ